MTPPLASTLAPLTVGRFFGTWQFDPWVTATAVVLLAAYWFGVRTARRRGTSWPAWRVAIFAGLGVGVMVIATMSSVIVYSRVLLWPMALQVSLLLGIVPVGFGLGNPVGLVSACLNPAGAARWQGLLRARPVQILTFPAVAPILAVTTQFLVFFTGYIGAAQGSGTVMHLLYLQLVATGCLFALPMFGVEIHPPWCTQAVRMVVVTIDGLLDAVPGIAVMTSKTLVAAGYYAGIARDWGPTRHWDQAIGGGLMLTLAEAVAVPVIGIIYVAWIREDTVHANEVDRALDQAEAARRALTPADQEVPVERPWWEIDPGPLADRAARYGWRRPE